MDTSGVARGDAAVEGELISLLFGSFCFGKDDDDDDDGDG